jgi:hypothetical protein
METSVKLDKERIYAEVRERIECDPSLMAMPSSARCFYYGIRTVEALRKAGLHVLLQAGSCSWPRIRPEQDDGVAMTHFSYLWTPEEPASQRAMRLGIMPEMHVWAADPEANEIIDFTSGFFPEQAKALVGFDWPGDLPPKYLWANTKDIPRGVQYRADIDAIKLAFSFAVELYGKKYVREVLL